jgi:serine protease Do
MQLVSVEPVNPATPIDDLPMLDRTQRAAFRMSSRWLLALGLAATTSFARADAPHRRDATVQAIEQNAPAIVNIHGQKTVSTNEDGHGEQTQRVNGMGTGVVIDVRGYILTNFHVVDGVKKIQVTLVNGQNYVATLVAHDPKTDLAVIKISAGRDALQVITIGTSDDLMWGETVIAVGNAYGYEHTVTRGVVSALHRTVPVSGSQTYKDLIQVDASINPGNSGGPLLNIDGEMIGINVAVRQGAQGIGFAIPVDTALAIGAELMNTARVDNTWHGIVPVLGKEGVHQVIVQELEEGSPAQSAGLQPGDVITAVGERPLTRPLDLETAILGMKSGEEVELKIVRNSATRTIPLVLAKTSKRAVLHDEDEDVWLALGMELQPAPKKTFQDTQSKYRGGMKVASVRPNGPAAKQGIKQGDILVGLHQWETINMENVRYVIARPEFETEPLKFFVLRNGATLFGNLNVSIQR